MSGSRANSWPRKATSRGGVNYVMPPDQQPGRDSPVKCWGTVREDRHRHRRIIPGEPREKTDSSRLPWIKIPSGRRFTQSLTKRHQRWWMPQWPDSGSWESCRLNRAKTSSLISCRTYCSARDKQDMDHSSSSAVRQHGETLREDG